MPNISVLIIEDDEVAAEILQKFVEFKDPNARIEWCWNGYEALVRVQEFNPDLIFLDYMMPKIDGLAFLRDLRKLSLERPCQVAVVSAFVDEQKTKEFYETGADFVVAKPVNVNEIHDILDQALRKLK